MTICFEAFARRHRVRQFVLLSLIAFCVQSCASIQPPPGGPVDSTGARIDTTTPFNRQINVPRNSRIEFRFDRSVDRGTFMSSLSITPYINGILKFHWSGYDQVSVELPEPLRDSTTYTVQLSRDLKSRHGIALLEPIRLSFSTGTAIDTGVLNGYLLTPFVGVPMRASQIFVFAYDISIRNPDTLRFTRTPPDLLTQPNDQGVWQFLAMKVGHRYRVFAIADVYRNRVYDPGVDAFAVPPSDLLLDSAVKSNFYLRMSPAIDTIRPELQDVEVIDSFHIRARFSEAIDSNDVKAQNFLLSQGSVIAAYRENDKRPGQITLLSSGVIATNKTITLQILRDSVHDLSHNIVSDSAYKITFTSPESYRPTPPVQLIAAGLTDSVTGISQYPSIPVSFSDAVEHSTAEQTLVITDTGAHQVATRYHWLDDAHVYVRTIDSLRSNTLYTLSYHTGSFKSPVGQIPRDPLDTTYRFRFRTSNARDNGRLTGDITIADSFFTRNPASTLVVQLLNTNTNEIQESVLPHGIKHFTFEAPGGLRYRVRAYLSFNGKPVYDPGSLDPWRFGVPTGDFPGGEIEMRARWEQRKVDFEVK